MAGNVNLEGGGGGDPDGTTRDTTGSETEDQATRGRTSPAPTRTQDDSTSDDDTTTTEQTTVDQIPGSGASLGLDDLTTRAESVRDSVSERVGQLSTPEDSQLQAPEGASGDIDFRFSDRIDSVGDGSDIRSDTTGRQVARTIGQRGAQAGASVGVNVADRIGADESGRALGGSLGGLVGGLPGAVGTIGADAADTARFVGEPVTARVEPGAQLGAGDIGDAAVETGERAVETGTTVGDAGITGIDRRFDIDFDRRDRGDGAAVQFTDDPEVRSQLGAELTFGAATLGASPAAGAGVRGAATRTRSVDTDSVSDFLAGGGTDRGQLDLTGPTSRQRGDGSDDGPITIGGDDIAARQTDPEQTSVRPEFERGDDIDAAGAFQRRRDELQRGDRTVDDRSRDLAFERALSDDPATQTGSPTLDAGPSGSTAGAGAGGLGAVSEVNDPTGITPDGTANTTGGGPVGSFETAGVSTVGDLDATNDPTGVDPTGDVETDPTTTAIDTSGAGSGSSDIATDTLGDPIGTTDIDTATQPVGTDPGVDPVGDVGLGLDGRAATRVGGRTVAASRAASAATAADAFDGLDAAPDRTPGIGRGQGRRRPPRPPTPDRDDGVFDEEFDMFDTRTDTEDVVEPTQGLDAVDDDIMRGFDGP